MKNEPQTSLLVSSPERKHWDPVGLKARERQLKDL